MSNSKFARTAYVLDDDGFAKIAMLDETGKDIGLILARMQPERTIRGLWQEKISDPGKPYRYRFVTSSHQLEGMIEFEYRVGKTKIKHAMCDIVSLPLLQTYYWQWLKRRGTLVTYVITENGKPVTLYFRRLVMNATDEQTVCNLNKNGADLRKINLAFMGDYEQSTVVGEKVVANIAKIVKRGEMADGKPSGSVSNKKHDRFRVQFQRPSHQKTFMVSDYESREAACNAAEAYRYQIARDRKQVQNRYRRVWTADGHVYLEVEVLNRNGDVATTFLCDIEKLELVKSHRWASASNGYIVTSSGCILFHREVLPGFEKVDHINGNILDNRLVNLRDGSRGVNDGNKKKYKTNTSGITGVSYVPQQNLWKAQWHENKQLRSKAFSVDAHGYKEAKRLAIEVRKSVDTRLGLNIAQTQ